MSIEIPDAALTAITDAFIRLSNEMPKLGPVDRLHVLQRAVRESWPSVEAAIRADLRAQLLEKAGDDPNENILAFWDDNTGQYHGEGGSLSNWIVSALAGTEGGK